MNPIIIKYFVFVVSVVFGVWLGIKLKKMWKERKKN